MFNFTGKNKCKIDEYATIDNRKKTTVIKDKDNKVYYELITNPKELNSYIFKDNDLILTLNTYYENKLMKIDKVDQILTKNKIKIIRESCMIHCMRIRY